MKQITLNKHVDFSHNRELLIKTKEYCKRNDITFSQLIRQLLAKEVSREAMNQGGIYEAMKDEKTN